jgi:DMSO/TMAO reductase YedYZ molybdopterin-dependent catalytic subunit
MTNFYPFLALALTSVALGAPLVTKTYRPPNLETQIPDLDHVFTPNDSFFVRYHLANIPKIKAREWRLKIGGDAASKPLEFTLAELKRDFKQVEVAALALCSGNRRGLFEPHVPGVQWRYGAMGNARWKGVRLKDVLERAGVRDGAVEVVFDGADGPVLDKTPDFRKSIPIAKALDPDTLIAFEMNGKPLPQLQGFPARIIVPGWTATYWMKHLISVDVVSKPYDGYWMKTAYRIPKGKFPEVEGHWPGQETETNIPVTEIIVSSLVTNVPEGFHFKKGERVSVRGMAWDGGHGITKVEVSTDGGKTWEPARLKKDYGRYSWRQFEYKFTTAAKGELTIVAKATNGAGHTQREQLVANPAGYHHNVPQRLRVYVD